MVTRRKHSSAFKATVALTALKEDLTVSELCSKYEVSASQVSKWKKALLSKSSDIFADSSSESSISKTTERETEALYAKIGRLEVERDFLKKKLKENRPLLGDRKSMIKRTYPGLSISIQCDLLSVSRSNYYYKEKGESTYNLYVMRLMDSHHLEHPTHGTLQMQDTLREQGYPVNVKRIRRLMRKMDINVIWPKPKLSKLGNAKYKHPYLLKNLAIFRPNHVWQIDITYIPMRRGFMYLIAIIDVYSRAILSWSLSNTLDAINSITVFERAVAKYGAPEIMNSDQGSQYTSKEWVNTVKASDSLVSLNGIGRALDNIYIERFWRTIKQDHIYLNPADNGVMLKRGIEYFIKYYNEKKSHQGLNRKIPFTTYVKEILKNENYRIYTTVEHADVMNIAI